MRTEANTGDVIFFQEMKGSHGKITRKGLSSKCRMKSTCEKKCANTSRAGESRTCWREGNPCGHCS